MSDPGRRAPGLYLHFPYCSKKCNYCDFYSVTSRADGRWAAAVVREVASLAPRFGEGFGTLYLGGGTPSLLAAERVAHLIDGLGRHVGLAAGCEVSVEANPDDVTRALVEGWALAGVGRVSLGIQSFEPDALRWMGRRHTAVQAHSAVEALREGGIPDLGIDIIFGLPGQDDESWSRGLATAVALQPDHISCYQLTAEGRTPLVRQVERGQVLLPADGRTRRHFVMAHDLLTGAGYEHYEVSNYARPGRRSRHNTRYWDRTPYLGLGPSAHSFVGDLRWWNVRHAEEYLRRIESAGDAIDEEETLTTEQLFLERLMLGFRTSEGVPARDLVARPRGRETLEQLIEEGLLRTVESRVVPTLDGFLVADSLPLRFA